MNFVAQGFQELEHYRQMHASVSGIKTMAWLNGLLSHLLGNKSEKMLRW